MTEYKKPEKGQGLTNFHEGHGLIYEDVKFVKKDTSGMRERIHEQFGQGELAQRSAEDVKERLDTLISFLDDPKINNNN